MTHNRCKIILTGCGRFFMLKSRCSSKYQTYIPNTKPECTKKNGEQEISTIIHLQAKHLIKKKQIKLPFLQIKTLRFCPNQIKHLLLRQTAPSSIKNALQTCCCHFQFNHRQQVSGLPIYLHAYELYLLTNTYVDYSYSIVVYIYELYSRPVRYQIITNQFYNINSLHLI